VAESLHLPSAIFGVGELGALTAREFEGVIESSALVVLVGKSVFIVEPKANRGEKVNITVLIPLGRTQVLEMIDDLCKLVEVDGPEGGIH